MQRGEHPLATCVLAVVGVAACGGRTPLEVAAHGSDASVSPPSPSPASAPSPLSVGLSHSCLVRAGLVYCWGSNTDGELGDPIPSNRGHAAAVSGVADVVEVNALSNATCVRLGDGSVDCWGRDSEGQLGDGFHLLNAKSVTPVIVSGVSNALGLSHGAGSFECARLPDDAETCWGEIPPNWEAVRPAAFAELAGSHVIAEQALFYCAIFHDGSLNCSGEGDFGQLGPNLPVGTSDFILQPVADAVDVAVGYTQTCAIRRDGSVVCWGGTDGEGPDPKQVDGIAGARQIGGGNGFACALLSDATVDCWGTDSMGQLGDGGGPAHSTPTAVPGVAGVVDLEVGNQHACVLTADQRVLCWGDNSVGELGAGTIDAQHGPVQVQF